MNRKFPVLFNGARVGSVELDRDGAYYRVNCSCSLSTKQMCRLAAESGGKKFRLGLLIPRDGLFHTKSRLRVSEISLADLCFCVMIEQSTTDAEGYPVFENAPFDHLAELDTAKLVIGDQQIRVIPQSETMA